MTFSIPKRPGQFRHPIQTPRMLAEAKTEIEIPAIRSWYDTLGRDSQGNWNAYEDLPTLITEAVSRPSRRVFEVEKITPIPSFFYETEEMPTVILPKQEKIKQEEIPVSPKKSFWQKIGDFFFE